MPTIRAFNENGVFRPLDPVESSDGSTVTDLPFDERIRRELQLAFDEVDRGEVSDLDLDELLAEAHRRSAARHNPGR